MQCRTQPPEGGRAQETESAFVSQSSPTTVSRPDSLASLLSLSSPTPRSLRSTEPPPSLSLSLSPCRREQVRLRRRSAGGVLAASARTTSAAVTTETSVCSSVSSLHTSLSAEEDDGGMYMHGTGMPEVMTSESTTKHSPRALLLCNV
ncbi:hypothetical protein EYF80_022063 [Liparis tanakae]|uniref:Uncharacterized protein n=1 Tax=Liparis tanakae TaxID=230148 RepID=A0A4Z2HPP4_9TELE|nr:hypothetical protein EYF80_022063 [Liparis tanakae]